MTGTIVTFGVLLVALGAAGYALSGGASLTALIPSVFGLLLCASAALARRPDGRRKAALAAALTALIGLAGVAPGVLRSASGLTRGELSLAGGVQWVMFVLLTVLLGPCLRALLVSPLASQGGETSAKR